MIRRMILAVAIAAGLSLAVPGCDTAPKSEAGRALLQDEGATALKQMEQTDAGLKAFVDKSYGYAIFPSVGKGGIGVGGAYGRGTVYEKGALVGYSDLSQATIGLQLGGQEYMQLVVFESKESLDRFRSGKFQFSANASAVALKAGAAAGTNFKDGMAIFTATGAGLMFEASVGGQQFSYQAK